MPRFNVTIRPYHDANRPHLKWVVNCYHPAKGRQRAFFKTREQAYAEATLRKNEAENYGLRALELTGPQRIETLAVLSLLKPHGVTITEVVRDFVERRQGSMATFGEVARLYLDSRQKLERSPRYLSTLENTFSRLTKTFGDRRLSEINPGEFQDWIESQEVSAQTNNHFRAMLHSLFQFALRRKIIRENVIKDIERHRVKSDKVGILTPEQMRRLLETAVTLADPGLVATFAIGGFAGVRPEEVARLSWSAIDLDHGQIDCGSEITKTAKHRYVKIEPVLAKWLQIIPDFIPTRPAGEMIQGSNFRRRFDLARRLAGLDVSSELFRLKPDSRGSETATPDELKAARAGLAPWPHDALRHSYASYHLAQFQDAARLALQLGHESTKMIFKNYRERVKTADAEAWWKLLPNQAPADAQV